MERLNPQDSWDILVTFCQLLIISDGSIFFLVSVLEENDILPYEVYYNMSLEALKDARKCLQAQTLSPEQVASMNESLDTSWLRGHSNPAIILFGRRQFARKLFPKLQELYNEIGL